MSGRVGREGGSIPGEGEEGLAVGGNGASLLEGEGGTTICGQEVQDGVRPQVSTYALGVVDFVVIPAAVG